MEWPIDLHHCFTASKKIISLSSPPSASCGSWASMSSPGRAAPWPARSSSPRPPRSQSPPPTSWADNFTVLIKCKHSISDNMTVVQYESDLWFYWVGNLLFGNVLNSKIWSVMPLVACLHPKVSDFVFRLPKFQEGVACKGDYLHHERRWSKSRINSFLSGVCELWVSLHLRSPHANWPFPDTTSFSVRHRIATCKFNWQFKWRFENIRICVQYKVRQQLMDRVLLTQKLEFQLWKSACLAKYVKTCFVIKGQKLSQQNPVHELLTRLVKFA